MYTILTKTKFLYFFALCTTLLGWGLGAATSSHGGRAPIQYSRKHYHHATTGVQRPQSCAMRSPFTSKVDPNFNRAGIKGYKCQGKLGTREWRQGALVNHPHTPQRTEPGNQKESRDVGFLHTRRRVTFGTKESVGNLEKCNKMENANLVTGRQH